MNHDTPFVATIKVIGTWLLVGVSHMSPLQFVQFIAAILAVIYTSAQLVILIRSWWTNRGKRNENR